MQTAPAQNGQLSAALDRLARLQTLTAALLEAVTSEQVADAILTHTLSVLEANAGVIYRLSEEGTELTCLRMVGYPAEVARVWSRFPADARTPVADAVRAARPVVVSSAAEMRDRYPYASGFPTLQGEGGAVALPLVVRGRALGGLGLRFRTDRSFTEQDQAFLLTVAGLCAQALDRAQLYDTERAARERAERAEAGREQLAAIIEATPDFVAVARLDGTLIYVNRAGRRLLGLGEQDDLSGLRHADLCPAWVHERTQKEWLPAALRDGSATGEGALRALDQREIPVSFALQIHRSSDGEPELISTIARDISERRRNEAVLRQSEALLRRVLDSNAIGLILADSRGRIVQANDAFLDMVGHDRADLSSGQVSLLDMTPPEYRALDERAREEMLRAGRHEPFEKEYLRKDGSRVPVLMGAASLGEEDGQECGIGFIIDLSEQKKAQAALRASEERLRTLSNNLPHGAIYQVIADEHGHRRFLYISAGVERLFGVTPAEALADATILYGLIDEEDRPRVAAAEEAALRDMAVYDCEFRSRTRAGEVRWFHCRSAPRRLPAGEVVWEGVLLDVTQWRQAEHESRASQQRLDLVVSSVDVGLWYCDLPFDKLTWNAKVKEHFGLPADAEVTIETFYERLHPDYRERTRQAIERSIQERSGYDIEYLTVGLDGRERWVRAIGRTFYAPSGEPVSFDGITVDVTERVRAEELLRESEERLRQLADAMPQIVYILRPDGTTEYLNRQWREYTGLENADDANLTQVIHPDDLGLVLGKWHQAQTSVESYSCELRLRRAIDGEYRWFLTRAVPGWSEQGRVLKWYGTSTDIHDHKRVEEELRERNREIETLMRLMPIGVSQAHDPACRRITCNPTGYDIFRLPRGRNISQSAPPEELPRNHRVFRQGKPAAPEELPLQLATARGVEVRDTEIDLVFDDGIVKNLHVFATPLLDDQGKVRGGFATMVDITVHRQLEAELRHKAEQLTDANRRKDEFLATLAHELRNPLAPLRNGLQVLKLARGNTHAIEQAQGMMERQLAQMVRLIDDLLDVSRITRGKLQLRRERVELAAVVQSAVEGSRPQIEASAHTLTITLPPEPVPLDADPTRLAQVLANLLTNAAKYTDRGGHIQLTAQRQGSAVLVTVRDNGIGIPAEHLPRLFEMFSQVAPARERSQGGLGIGLSLVKGLVEMHGGSVEARSEGLGKGSAFIVRLPLVPGSVGPEPAPAETGMRVPTCRILVADDNRDAAESLAMMLRLAGHKVHTAHDGQEAVTAANGFRPDVALLDIGMPKLNGLQVCRHLRAQGWAREMVLVAVTGWGQEEDKRQASEAGFDHHLTKPVDPAALDELLGKLVPRR